MPAKSRTPKYCFHKPTGQAYVRLDGRCHYLGAYDSKESKGRYRELVDQWRLRIDPDQPVETTVGELCVLFLDYARSYYVKDGRPTSEVGCFEAAIRFLMPYRRQPARDFGPLALEAARNEMIRAGLVRTSINSQIGRIRRVFRWAVSKQLVRPDVLVSLSVLPPLRQGRSQAAEAEPVGPVDLEDVRTVLPHLTPPLRAVVEVLLLTGARSGEILPMRTGEIDRSVDPWEYRPRTHKTIHKGKTRLILLGPKAQGIILPLLVANADAFVFRPGDAVDRGYAKGAVRKAISRVIERENEKRAEKNEQLGDDDEPLPMLTHWHPHQLRHTAATRFKKEHGVEIAKNVLGHAKLEMTELYAERDLTAARAVIAKIG